MIDSNVTRVFSPDEALAFVIERGVITMPISELAAAWGWPHCSQVYRALGRWVRDGWIEHHGQVIRARAWGGQQTPGCSQRTRCRRSTSPVHDSSRPGCRATLRSAIDFAKAADMVVALFSTGKETMITLLCSTPISVSACSRRNSRAAG